jgi:hypothetical protein
MLYGFPPQRLGISLLLNLLDAGKFRIMVCGNLISFGVKWTEEP